MILVGKDATRVGFNHRRIRLEAFVEKAAVHAVISKNLITVTIEFALVLHGSIYMEQ